MHMIIAAVILALAVCLAAGQARAEFGMDQTCYAADQWTAMFELTGSRPFFVEVIGGDGTAQLYRNATNSTGSSYPVALDDAQTENSTKRAEAGAVYQNPRYMLYIDVSSPPICVEVIQ
jgi:hypothetical protein